MIHIGHSHTNPPPSPPKAALPILASHLLDLEEKQRKRFAGKGRAERLSTGCKEIDEVLGDGVERGVVLGISSGVEGREGRLLSLHLLASVLLPNVPLPGKAYQSTSLPQKTKTTIIDTTGSFPLALLASVLKSRLLQIQSQTAQNAIQTGNYAVQQSGKSGNETKENDRPMGVDEQVQKCLEMVAISRVFDVEGLWEVIGELDHFESVAADNDSGDENMIQNETEKTGGGKREDAVEQEKGDDEPEILDSEDELTPSIETSAPKDTEENDREDEGTEIIIVDNMTHIINELFARKEKNDAHTLLTLLSSTLHTISKTRNILTILHNTTNPSSTSTSHYPPAANQPQTRNPNALHATTARSIFASTATKPALGQIFAQFPDLHIFLHHLPKTRRDAEVLYGGGGGVADSDVFHTTTTTTTTTTNNSNIFTNSDAFTTRDKPTPANCQYTTILEVLKDEAALLDDLAGGADAEIFGYREQKWTAVDVSPDGLGMVGAFAERGGMKGMGMSRERGGTRIEEGLSGGVGNVAKVWGFGGRRV